MTGKITIGRPDLEITAAREEPWVGAVRYRFGRAIGPWGSAARVAAAAAAFAWALAVPHNHAIPNWLLRRHDRLFCLLFTPIDAFEARKREA